MDKDQLVSDLRADEGVRTFPYRDSVGKLTIGVGRNLDDVGLARKEIDFLLSNDIDRVTANLNHLLPWWQQMSEPRQRALCNFVFNVGLTKALTFKNSLKFLQDGQYEKAADEFLNSLWAKQVGARAKRISDMIRNG